MKYVFLILVFTALAGCAISRPQSLLVTDYGYSLDGNRAASLEQFNEDLRIDVPVAIEACSCADTRLVIEATEWLRGQGVKTVSMKTVPGAEARCGVCR
jgi:hypothetical protein